jgi:cytochrome c-type biogenesis protein
VEELLNSLYGNTSVPFWSALLLGLMTAISPCPLATNITAIGFISKDIENRKRVFLNGIYYTLGRAISYTTIGLLFYFGASQFELSGFFQQWGEKFIGPLLVVIGLFMLGVIKLNIPGLSSLSQRMEKKNSWGFWSSLLLGMLFALAFCPYSGVLYFGMLIPMTISSASGLYLPVVFAFATGLPVLLFAWFIAFSFSKLGGFYSKVKVFEKWFRKFVALLFIGVGLYYIN